MRKHKILPYVLPCLKGMKRKEKIEEVAHFHARQVMSKAAKGKKALARHLYAHRKLRRILRNMAD